MHIKPHEIHVWSIALRLSDDQEKKQLAILSDDEEERAGRFYFPIHRQRFIAAHAALRQILSLYVNLAAKDIVFGYTEYKKPYLQTPEATRLQFNLSHSDDLAVCAITLDHAVGIDIEKVEDTDKQDIAARFFSPRENAYLAGLSQPEKTISFYRLWSRKEALLKAIGKGLFIPLSSFTVSLHDEKETITLENETWSLHTLPHYLGYQSAVASNQDKIQICHWDFLAHGTPKPRM